MKKYEQSVVALEKLINARRQISTMIRHYLVDKSAKEKLRLIEEKKKQKESGIQGPSLYN